MRSLRWHGPACQTVPSNFLTGDGSTTQVSHEALGWEWTTAVHPDDLDPLTDRWRALLASGQAGAIEARLRRYDGEYRWFLFRAEPMRDSHGHIFKWYGAIPQRHCNSWAEPGSSSRPPRALAQSND